MTTNPSRPPAITVATVADSERLTDWCLCHPPVAVPPAAGGARAGRRANLLARCIEDGCVLVASEAGYLRGLVALDLDHGAIGELVTAGLRGDPGLVDRLLVAIERLAVRFGFRELALTVPAGAQDRFAPLGYRLAERSGGTANAPLVRPLGRRQTRYGRRVLALCAELGIPADYARRHRLPIQTEAVRLASIGSDVFGRRQRLVPEAARAWRQLVGAAARQGVAVQAVSAFRTLDYQRGLILRKLQQGESIDRILRVSAAPGFSEHHTGRAVDVTTPGAELLQPEFERTAAFAWLQENARAHGFRLSFPRNNRHGLAYEPWHWCFRTRTGYL